MFFDEINCIDFDVYTFKNKLKLVNTNITLIKFAINMLRLNVNLVNQSLVTWSLHMLMQIKSVFSSHEIDVYTHESNRIFINNGGLLSDAESANPMGCISSPHECICLEEVIYSESHYASCWVSEYNENKFKHFSYLFPILLLLITKVCMAQKYGDTSHVCVGKALLPVIIQDLMVCMQENGQCRKINV